ncbi:hypothetical protein GGI20_004407 [Coemansia sp. BCRC 34301]|nr:hypothetical protein GGI20_004407 [Coemansia sp. BCRC 34301]
MQTESSSTTPSEARASACSSSSRQLAPLDTTTASKAPGFHIQLPTPDGQLPPSPPWCAASPVEAVAGVSSLLSPKFPTPAPANENDPNAFTPYFMQTAEPRAPELQRQPSARIAPPRRENKLSWPGRRRSSEASSTSPPPASASASASPPLSPSTTGMLTPGAAADCMGEESESSVTMLKRSLSTLLRRSTSIVRRTDSNSRRKVEGGSVSTRSNLSEDTARSQEGSFGASAWSGPQTPADTPSSSQATSPQLAAATLPLPTSDFGEALTASTFNVRMVNAIVSPLIGNSMVHVKVIMDASNITIVPMVRSVVFARARERILTKLFQGGVPFVDSKRRKLAVRKPDGSLVVVADNQTWRCVMDAASVARAHQPGVAADATAAGYKTVVKLALHLIDPAEITERLATTGCRSANPAPLEQAVAGRACST